MQNTVMEKLEVKGNGNKILMYKYYSDLLSVVLLQDLLKEEANGVIFFSKKCSLCCCCTVSSNWRNREEN